MLQLFTIQFKKFTFAPREQDKNTGLSLCPYSNALLGHVLYLDFYPFRILPACNDHPDPAHPVRIISFPDPAHHRKAGTDRKERSVPGLPECSLQSVPVFLR